MYHRPYSIIALESRKECIHTEVVIMESKKSTEAASNQWVVPGTAAGYAAGEQVSQAAADLAGSVDAFEKDLHRTYQEIAQAANDASEKRSWRNL